MDKCFLPYSNRVQYKHAHFTCVSDFHKTHCWVHSCFGPPTEQPGRDFKPVGSTSCLPRLSPQGGLLRQQEGWVGCYEVLPPPPTTTYPSSGQTPPPSPLPLVLAPPPPTKENPPTPTCFFSRAPQKGAVCHGVTFFKKPTPPLVPNDCGAAWSCSLASEQVLPG